MGNASSALSTCPQPGGRRAVAVLEEAVEPATGRVERTLLYFGSGTVADERSAFIVDDLAHDFIDRPFSQPRSFMEIADQRATQEPQIVAMPAQGFAREAQLNR